MNPLLKQAAGRIAAAANPQCRYDRTVFILGHMRCGSTALSHVLCGHPAISGFGEAHIAYHQPGALGLLALAQARRGAWKPRARHLFDKILHSRYDGVADSAFGNARAIFLVRDPADTIRSIRHLFTALGSAEYAADQLVADYYEERLGHLCAHWAELPAARRIGFSFAELTAAPDASLAGISSMLDLPTALTNRYERPKRALGPGTGDPLSSHKFNAIVSSNQTATVSGQHRALRIPSGRISELEALYREACRLFTYDRADANGRGTVK